MNRYVLGLAPSVLVALGLHVGHSVILTFALFYSWLGIIPSMDYLVCRKNSLARTIGDWGLTASARQMIVGLSLGISLLITLLIGANYLHDMLFDIERLRSLLKKWDFSGDQSVLLLLILVLLNPILEEIYWRGYLYHRIGQKLGSAENMLLASFWFTSYHLVVIIPVFSWPLNVVAAIPIFAAGVLWGWIRHRTGSVLIPIISHMFADLGIVITYMQYVQ
ncbi:CPBP family intramembrane glutamic endopeptidase [Paenibacillus sp. MAH-36]|uniref:CPBP family intramembrane glutamic endopeptidase n=1 Tax=Paenibacillus violae TaxID=3077234 RepID=A0ABU3R9A9_9BACL|nr:CPBP family intramembrane glutamic endopeptidase [Paenibacillus sp. PFR10]MDU0200865.1 CPBP family intramembrane glutamic endopeptidase [Paenibacillus sp. PFR10]